MKVTVTGKSIKVGDSLRDYVSDRLEKGVKKYFDRAVIADVVFYKEAHLFCADILVNEGTGNGLTIKGQAKTDDIYAAFDMACDRIEKQLRRYKRRLKNTRNDVQRKEVDFDAMVQAATKYVIADDGQELIDEEDNPLIIAEKQTTIEKLSVSDAVMRMNLANLPALMFINKKTGGINIVYRRNDGNISWVDSTLKAA